jgi:acyl-coenzyme A thioesterase PaaI-like protein
MAIGTDERINVDLDHNCFGCGRLNAHGLQLAFHADARGGVWADFVPAERFEGYTGMVHGGVISAVLDEVMAWSLYRNEIWAVTGELSVRFRAPVEVGDATRATGWRVSQHGRRIEMASELRRRRDGAVLATATALFIRVPEAQAAAWRERYLARKEAT